MSSKTPRRFPLELQLTLPESLDGDRDFSRLLALAGENGMAELELNILEPELVDPEKFKKYLGNFGLSMTRLASGGLARRHGLTLSSCSESVRRESVSRCVDLIRYAALFSAELIVGLLKGKPEGDPAAERKRFIQSLSELAEACAPGSIPLLLEATNRYESSVANTLEEAAELSAEYADRRMGILPDTFHMNIKESNTLDALSLYSSRFHSLHISDNNRLLPGLGAIDFARLFAFLAEIGYAGSLVLEGNTRESFWKDLETSIGFIDRLIRTA